jgi:hypothetical protein
MLCPSVNMYQHFWGTYRLHLLSWWWRQEGSSKMLSTIFTDVMQCCSPVPVHWHLKGTYSYIAHLQWDSTCCRLLAGYLPGLLFDLEHGSNRSQDSAVSIVTGYGLDSQGVRVQVWVVARIFSSPHCPHWFCSPPSLIFRGVLEDLSWGGGG